MGLERLAPMASGAALVLSQLRLAVVFALAGAASHVARLALRTRLAHRARITFVSSVAHSASLLSALQSRHTDRVEGMLLTGSYASARLWSEEVPAVIANGLALLIAIPIAVTLAPPKLLVATAAALGLAGLGMGVLRRAFASRARRASDQARSLTQSASFLLRGHADLVASGRAVEQAQRVSQQGERWSLAVADSERILGLGSRLPIVVALMAVGLASWLAVDGASGSVARSAGRLLVVGGLVPIAASLGRAWMDMARSRADIDAVDNLLTGPLDPRSPEHAVALDPSAPIRFHNVRFGYGPGARVLDGVSLTWQPDELLAVTGPNGAGKTTLLRLLLRLADPEEGALFVGATDLREGDARLWREAIAYLPQRPFLPEQATLREVIETWGADAAKVSEALGQMQLTDKLGSLHPDDPLATRVCELSAGERQRFCIAKVLGATAPIVLMDEPDANLDAAGQRALLTVLARRSPGRRVLFVAHDSRFLAVADRVLDLGTATTSSRASAAHS